METSEDQYIDKAAINVKNSQEFRSSTLSARRMDSEARKQNIAKSNKKSLFYNKVNYYINYYGNNFNNMKQKNRILEHIKLRRTPSKKKNTKSSIFPSAIKTNETNNKITVLLFRQNFFSIPLIWIYSNG